MPANIELNIDNHIALICLNNPEKHNSLASSDIDLFIDLLNQIKADSNVRVLVVTGTGDKTFCAGASLDQLSSGDMSGDKFETMTNKLASIEVPSICALNGSAYGGGVEIGLCCDFRIGVKGMRAFVPAARFGLCYPINGIQRYVLRLGANVAKRFLVASEEFTGEDLLALGYLTHLVEKDQLQSSAMTLAEKISGLAPLATVAMKSLCDHISMSTLEQDAARAIINKCNQSMDLQEGLQAAQQKRPAVFIGK